EDEARREFEVEIEGSLGCGSQQRAQASAGRDDEQGRTRATRGRLALDHRSGRSRVSMSNGHETKDSRGTRALAIGESRGLARHRRVEGIFAFLGSSMGRVSFTRGRVTREERS